MEADGTSPYYESIDMEDAYHPQTILAYELNDATLPVPNGAPVRLRVERQLGYKHAKYIMRIELVESFDNDRRRQGRLLGRSGLRVVRRHLSRSLCDVAARRPSFLDRLTRWGAAGGHTSRFARRDRDAERPLRPLLPLRRADGDLSSSSPPNSRSSSAIEVDRQEPRGPRHLGR